MKKITRYLLFTIVFLLCFTNKDKCFAAECPDIKGVWSGVYQSAKYGTASVRVLVQEQNNEKIDAVMEYKFKAANKIDNLLVSYVVKGYYDKEADQLFLDYTNLIENRAGYTPKDWTFYVDIDYMNMVGNSNDSDNEIMYLSREGYQHLDLENDDVCGEWAGDFYDINNDYGDGIIDVKVDTNRNITVDFNFSENPQEPLKLKSGRCVFTGKIESGWRFIRLSLSKWLFQPYGYKFENTIYMYVGKKNVLVFLNGYWYEFNRLARYDNGFDLRKNAYNVLNVKDDVYSDNKIPLDIYQKVFKDIGSKEYKDRYIVQDFSGHCVSLAITSVLLYEGRIDIKEYGFSKEEDVTKSTSDYQPKEDGKDVLCYMLTKTDPKDKKILNLLEEYHVWSEGYQYKTLCETRALTNNKNENVTAFKNMIADIENNQVPYILDVRSDRVGHTVVVNSNVAPRDMGDFWYRIYVYDPNFPYDSNIKNFDKMSNMYYLSDNRYIDVNIGTGEWRIAKQIGGDKNKKGMVVEGYYGYNEKGKYQKEHKLSILSPDDFPTSFSKRYSFLGINVDKKNIGRNGYDILIPNRQPIEFLKILNGKNYITVSSDENDFRVRIHSNVKAGTYKFDFNSSSSKTFKISVK